MQIISRSQWGALPAKRRLVIETLPAPEVWIHHTANSMPGHYQVRADEQREMEGIQKYHLSKWDDIAYSFVIMDSGNIYEGRGWGIVGAHTENHNSRSHGIAFAGNFQIDDVEEKAMDACRWLIREGKHLGQIKSGTQPTGGHRDTKATACPGDLLYRRMNYLRVSWTEPTPEPPTPGDPEEEEEMVPGRSLRDDNSKVEIMIDGPQGKKSWVKIVSANPEGPRWKVSGTYYIESPAKPGYSPQMFTCQPDEYGIFSIELSDWFKDGGTHVLITAETNETSPDGKRKPLSIWGK